MSGPSSRATYIKSTFLRNCALHFSPFRCNTSKNTPFCSHLNFHVIQILILSHLKLLYNKITSTASHLFSYTPFTSYRGMKMRNCVQVMTAEATFQACRFWCSQLLSTIIWMLNYVTIHSNYVAKLSNYVTSHLNYVIQSLSNSSPVIRTTSAVTRTSPLSFDVFQKHPNLVTSHSSYVTCFLSARSCRTALDSHLRCINLENIK